jgi:hypothetical protein
MTATAAPKRNARAGRRVEQARYRIREGARGLYAQRIDGRVALIDAPIDHNAPVLLVERHVESLAELEGIVGAYVEQSIQAGMPALEACRQLLDNQATSDAA